MDGGVMLEGSSTGIADIHYCQDDEESNKRNTADNMVDVIRHGL
jgi:hypothetical protein